MNLEEIICLRKDNGVSIIYAQTKRLLVDYMIYSGAVTA